MIQLNKYGSSYNFDLKGHKIANFKNWVELQAWADCTMRAKQPAYTRQTFWEKVNKNGHGYNCRGEHF